MDDSWQKLMGIECGSEEGPSSPVFHKKKWVVLPTSLKRSGSGSLLTKCPEKKMKNKRNDDSSISLQTLNLNNTMPPEDNALKNTNADEDDPLLIYSTTPTKKCKQKRKTIDLLSCSFRSEGGFCKKSKLSDEKHFEVSQNPSGINSEKNVNDQVSETLSTTYIRATSPQSNQSNLSQKSITSKPRRKLLYSCNKNNITNMATPTLTVNDILRSVIMIDEADINSSPKKNRKLCFEVKSNDFQSVTSLSRENLKDCRKGINDHISPPSVNTLEKCDISFGDNMATEIKNECISTKELSLKSTSNEKLQMTPNSPVDINPMDETFSNYRFTEIEEDYGCFNHKKLNDNEPVASSLKLEGTGSLSPIPQNSVGRNTFSTSKHKNDCLNNKSYGSLNNERDQILSQENGLEDLNSKSDDTKDIFNSTVLPQKSVLKLETAIDKEHFLSTSKDCFNELDAISTEEFRNNHLEKHHELNLSLKEIELNQSIDNKEKDMLDRSFASKLDVTLTDIMQRLVKRSPYNESKPNLKHQIFDKKITINRNYSFDRLTQEVTAEEMKSEKNEQCEQALGNISLSESILEPPGLSIANETAFLTQEYLENVKPEVSVDTSVAYYQQSFDYMISAEVKSRLSGNNCIEPSVEQETSLLDQSLSSEVVADNNGRLFEDSFINTSYKYTDLNESDASNLNKSINIENPLKSPTDIHCFNNSSEIKFSQYGQISHNHENLQNVEIQSKKQRSNFNNFSNQPLRKTVASSVNNDFISQGCLQQFNCSFQLKSDDLVSQKKENNLDNGRIDLSESKNILDDTILITPDDNAACDGVGNEDKEVLDIKKYAESVDLQKLSGSKFINTYEMNKCAGLAKKHSEVNSSNVKKHCVNNDVLKTVPVVFQNPSSPVTHHKSNANYNPTSPLGKSINISEESSKIIKPILNDNLVKSKNNFQHSLIASNSDRDKLNSDKINPAEDSLSFNIGEKNIDVSKNVLRDVQKVDVITNINQEFKSPLPRLNKVNNFMFSSAGGKKIEVSENALAKVKSMFNEILVTDPIENIDAEDNAGIDQAYKILPGSSKAGNLMLSSASGKNIKISEDATNKTKSKFNEMPDSRLIDYRTGKDKTDVKQVSKSFLTSCGKDENFMFSSAGGKNIKISDEALMKVKSKFNDIYDCSIELVTPKAETDVNLTNETSSSGKNDNLLFSSASSKNIKGSKDALVKVKSKFQDILKSHPIQDKNSGYEADMNLAPFSNSSKNNNFIFSTAGGKNIKVSDVALAKVKFKFNEIMESHEEQIINDNAETNIDQEPIKFLSCSNKTSDFTISNASRKIVQVSEEPPAQIESKSNKVFDRNIEDKTDVILNRKTQLHKPNQTSRKIDAISQDVLAQTKTKCSETFERMPTEVKNIETEADINLACKTLLPSSSKSDSFMFSTAGGKNVKVSDVALAKVKSKFNEIMETHETEKMNDNAEKNIDQAPKMFLSSSNKNDNFMFSTAGGKNITVSDVALAKVKSKFSEIMETDVIEIINEDTKKNIDQVPKGFSPSSSKAHNFMFSSASGKNIQVSKDALTKVKSKYNEILGTEIEIDITEEKKDDHQASKICFPNSSKTHSFMFSSASGKQIEVSEDSLAKVKSKFNEIMESHVINDKPETNIDQAPIKLLPSSNKTSNLMFSSASGKNIQVSNDALIKVKSKYNDILGTEVEIDITEEKKDDHQASEKNISNSSKAHNFMFSSASGKNIEVSEDSLAKVKSKFNEIMESHETKLIKDKTGINIDQAPTNSFPNPSITNNMFLSSCDKSIQLSENALAIDELKFKETSESHPTKDRTDYQSPKTALPGLIKADNFMFSSASGKSIQVSGDSLAKVKSKFNDIFESCSMEINDEETRTSDNLSSNSLLKSSNKFDNISLSTASGNNNKVSDVDSTKLKSNLYKISANNLPKVGNDEFEMHECQLLETSFSCFDKSDPFCFPLDECKNIEISDGVLDKKKSKLSGISKDNRTEIELSKSRNELHESSKVSLLISHKKDDSMTFSADFNASVNVKEKSSHRKTLVSFPARSKTHEIERENIPDKCSEVKFSTARGKHISVSEDALLKIRSKFSEVMDTSMHQSEDEKNNDYIFQNTKSSNQNLTDDACFLDPFLEKNKSNESDSCLAKIPIPNNQTPKSSQMFTKVNMNKNLFNSLTKNDKKSKYSHTENSTSDQPLAKKVCFQPGIVNLTQKSLRYKSDHSVLKESQIQNLTFTQSISQSLLDQEMDAIENKKAPRENLNLNSEVEECLKNQSLETNKCDSQLGNEESDMTMIYEISDSAAAFMADCTPERSVLSSPSSFFNRKSLKPIKLLEMEFDDVDEEIMVAAELKINPEPVINNPVNDNALGNINFRYCSAEVLSIRNDQRKRTDEVINQKLKYRPQSSPGLYMTLRNKGSLKRICENLQPFLDKKQLIQLGLTEEILSINSTSAETYEFCAESFFSYEECFSGKGIIDIGYGFSLILSDDNKIGLNELSRCFLSHPNVDPSLVSSVWVKNHFKWIIWKLASFERAFPRNISNRYLTPENVLHQLKYRYDREIDLAQRSALKKMLECDEPSSRRLIVCIADIRSVDSSDGESNYEIELTDGWYSVWAFIDPAMKNCVDSQKIKIGTKLITQGAELLNCTEGCDPLEISSSIRLKLHTNCVRRVKWDAKMGFTRHPGPIRVSLRSILHNGGLVGLTSAIIARVYPLLYMSKDADGKTVLRNAYAEHHASSLKENDLTAKSEELFEKLFPEVEAKYKSGVVKFDKNNITKINDPALLWRIVSNESDPSEIQSLMTPDQLIQIRKYHELVSSKIREEVQTLVKEKLEELIPSQKAKCLLKLRLVDLIGGSNAVLTVWNPSEDLLQILVEKKCFDFYALNASGVRDKVLQLSSTSRTIYKESNLLKPSKEFERKVTAIHDIVVNSLSVHFGEMDVVGTVIFVKEPEKPWGVTNVYLSDNQENFLMITFWTSLKTFGCDDTLKPGSTVACINLQWRQGSGSYVIPSTFANEMTYFSSNPNQEYLIKALHEIKSSIGSKGLENFIIDQRRRLFSILKEREYNSKTPISRVETPKILKRLENLKKYGEASPLPKLSLLSSPDIHRKFRSPKSGSS